MKKALPKGLDRERKENGKSGVKRAKTLWNERLSCTCCRAQWWRRAATIKEEDFFPLGVAFRFERERFGPPGFHVLASRQFRSGRVIGGNYSEPFAVPARACEQGCLRCSAAEEKLRIWFQNKSSSTMKLAFGKSSCEYADYVRRHSFMRKARRSHKFCQRDIELDEEDDDCFGLKVRLECCITMGNKRRLRQMLRHEQPPRKLIQDILVHAVQHGMVACCAVICMELNRRWPNFTNPVMSPPSSVLAVRNDSEELRALPILVEAVRREEVYIARILLIVGANPNAELSMGCTPIFLSAYIGDVAMMRLLIGTGATVNKQMRNGVSALAVACFRGKLKAVKVLVEEAKANIDVQTEDGTTPLITGVQWGFKEIVQYLLEKGANVNLCKYNGSSPIIVAVRHRHSELIPSLAAAGGDPDKELTNGATALILASANGDESAAIHLLSMNADIMKRLSTGAHALAYACHRGYLSLLVRLLWKLGTIDPEELERLQIIAEVKKHHKICKWLALFKGNHFKDLHFALTLDCVSKVKAHLQTGNFVVSLEDQMERKLFFRLAGRHTTPILERAISPFILSNIDVFPHHFAATVMSVLDKTDSGGVGDVILHVFSFCSPSWFFI